MAEEKRRRARANEERRSDSPKRGSRQRDTTAATLARRAREQLAEITGLEPEGVTSLRQHDDGTWKVVVELLELSRIPQALDVIGSYEVELDENGRLLGYQRVRRYSRSGSDMPQPVGEG